jgi:hypothetical protein
MILSLAWKQLNYLRSHCIETPDLTLAHPEVAPLQDYTDSYRKTTTILVHSYIEGSNSKL